MVNAQEWLESQAEYNTKEKRGKVRELNISGWDEKTEEEKEKWEKLTGSLDLSDFTALEKLDCSFNELTNLVFSNCISLKELNCSNNELNDLKIDYYCRQLEKICCSSNNFTKLEIENKWNLQELDCSHNKQLTDLTITDSCIKRINCSNCQIVDLGVYNNSDLTELNFSNNQLTSLEFLGDVYAPDLAFLDASNNKLADKDNSWVSEAFSRFTGLKSLNLNNNPLSISLEILKRCGRLEEVKIENTQITSGLEYLPESIKQIHCRGTKLAEEILFVEGEWGDSDYYDYQAWREKNWKEIIFAKFPSSKDEFNALEQENQELKKQLSEFREWKEKLVAQIEVAPK